MAISLSSQPLPAALSIRELPRSERPRERLVALGASALSSAELLALLVGAGGTGGSALHVGQALLAGCGGSVRRMAMQPVAALTATSGVGMARAVTVHAALELGRRVAAEVREDGAPVRSPRDVARLFAPRLEDLPVEEFHVAVLDAQHRLERDITVTRAADRRAILAHLRRDPTSQLERRMHRDCPCHSYPARSRECGHRLHRHPPQRTPGAGEKCLTDMKCRTSLPSCADEEREQLGRAER